MEIKKKRQNNIPLGEEITAVIAEKMQRWKIFIENKIEKNDTVHDRWKNKVRRMTRYPTLEHDQEFWKGVKLNREIPGNMLTKNPVERGHTSLEICRWEICYDRKGQRWTLKQFFLLCFQKWDSRRLGCFQTACEPNIGWSNLYYRFSFEII